MSHTPRQVLEAPPDHLLVPDVNGPDVNGPDVSGPDVSGPDVSVVVPIGSDGSELDVQLVALRNLYVGDHTVEFVLVRNTIDPDAAAGIETSVEGLADDRFVLVDAARRSAPHARNVGAAHSRGRFLLFCDADDQVDPAWLINAVEALDRHDAVGGELVTMHTGADRWTRPPATPGALPTFLGAPYIVSANLAIRRAAFDAVGGFDESLVTGEDIALSWSLLRAGRTLGYAPQAIVHYRPRTGLLPMLRQHHRYGQGMSQVLARHGVPPAHGKPAQRLAHLRANGQPGGRGSVARLLRRGAIASGRLRGLANEFALPSVHRQAPAQPPAQPPTQSEDQSEDQRGRRRALNVDIDNITMDELLLRRDGVVLTVHLDMLLALQRDREFYRLLPTFDVVTCDSQVLFAALRLLGRPVRERVSGSDYFPRLCAQLAHEPEAGVFLCGAAPGVADRAAAEIDASAGRRLVVGTASPPMNFHFPSPAAEEIVEAVRRSGATVLVVALGAPKQEKFIAHVRGQLPGVRLFLPLGGTLDYLSGDLARPPSIVTGAGLEWAWRLVRDPRRRWRRYLVEDPRVVGLLALDGVGRYRDPFFARPGARRVSVVAPAGTGPAQHTGEAGDNR